MIQFEAVEKRYPGGSLAVDGLSFTAPAGAITVLVGPSGCGKTTTLRMVNRMVEPTAGRVLLDGADVRAGRATELRRGIGYVIQHAGLFPHRTVVDNVATVPRLLRTGRADAKRRALDLLDRVGLDPELARRYPAQLSGGQQQRVGVARALAADPPVLLMDEPFSAVDPVVRKDLQDELLRLQGELGKTILLVTHDIDEAIRLGDRVAVLRVGGKLAQFASPVELLTEPVDGFVESFLGLDRGMRRLSFLPAARLEPSVRPVVTVGAEPDLIREAALHEPWLMVTDSDRRPLGWAAAGPARESGEVSPDALIAYGHSFAVGADSVRAALDATLLSRTGLAVGVDSAGRVVGVVGRAEIDAVVRAAAGEWAGDKHIGDKNIGDTNTDDDA